MSIVIERFTDYKGIKDFRDEVIKQVLECQEAKKVRAEYEAHFDEAVKAVADELCKKDNRAKNFYAKSEKSQSYIRLTSDLLLWQYVYELFLGDAFLKLLQDGL